MERVNFDYSSLKAYYGYYKNTQMLFTSSSGGAATAIAESFLNSVGGTYGVVSILMDTKE